MTAPLVFVDVETTGLDVERHPIWEVGLIDSEGHEHEWLLPVDLTGADPAALVVNGFHSRHPGGYDFDQELLAIRPVTPPGRVAYHIGKLTRGCHLVGANVSFDEERLRRFLQEHGICPEWHYHKLDVEALVAGYLAAQVNSGLVARAQGRDGVTVAVTGELPWDSTALSRAVGIEPGSFDRHTAIGDARWAQAMYQAVMAGVRVV